MADASPTGIFFYDGAADLDYVNDAGIALTGLEGEHLEGRGWERAIHPDDLERVKTEIGVAIAEGKGYSGEGRFLHTDGRVVCWEAHAAPVIVDGERLGFVSVVQDVSERIATEKELRQSQALLRGVMNSSPSAIAVKSTSGEYLFANEQAAIGIGLPAEDIPGKTLLDILPPEAAARNERKDREVIDSGLPTRVDEVYFRDGERFVLNVLRFPVFDSSRQVVALGVVATDITARLNAEEARERERRELATDIHDDSVQVMASVALQLEALAADRTSEADREMLNHQASTVRVAVRRLRDLMFDLGSDAPSDEDLVVALQELARSSTEGHPIAYEVEVDGEQLPALPLPLRSKLLRTAREAISNSVKHSGAALVTLEVRGTEGGVQLRIVDDGRGFDASLGSPDGHLGLASMNERMRSAGGRFEISSSPAGTVVDLWAPIGLAMEPRP